MCFWSSGKLLGMFLQDGKGVVVSVCRGVNCEVVAALRWECFGKELGIWRMLGK